MGFVDWLKKKLHIGVNANVKADLNKDNIVKNAAGIGFVGCFVGSTVEATRQHYPEAKALAAGGVVLGSIYVGLECLDEKKNEKQQKHDDEREDKKMEHDMEIARIKHPSGSSGTSETSSVGILAEKPQPKMEPFADSVQRGKQNPPRKWLVPGIFHEGYISNLFAPEKAGKSLLVTQIGLELAQGKISSLTPFNDEKYRCPSQIVFSYDVEQVDDDQAERYGDMQNIPSNFYRIPNHSFPSPEALLDDIKERSKMFLESMVFIIDNTSSVCQRMNESQVNSFIDGLKSIQKEAVKNGYRVSFIIVSHTVKGAKGKASTSQQAGSAHWARLCNESVKLENTSLGNDIKAIVPINSRGKGLIGKDEVLTIKLVEKPYVGFVFHKIVKESEALSGKSESKETSCEWNDKVPLETAREMSEWYQPGVNGHGWDATAKKFGIKHGEEAKRIIGKYREMYESED